MRREVLVHSLDKILKDLASTGIQLTIEEALQFTLSRANGGKESRPTSGLESFQKYSIAFSKYSEVDREICEILGLLPLSTAQFWQLIVDDPDPRSMSELQAIRFALRQTLDVVPKVLKLVGQEFVQEIKEKRDDLPVEMRGKSILSVIIPENQSQHSTPERLIYALSAIAKLYEVAAQIRGESSADLSVLACDSGSDKSFDFLGLSKAMEELRALILGIWDRIVFYRRMQLGESIKLISESLPVLQKIEELRASGAISPEQAEILRRKAIEGATLFVESGLLTSDMEAESGHSPRAIIHVEQKLLTGPSDAVHSSSSPHHDTEGEGKVGELTSDEEVQLELLLEKASRKKAAKKKAPKA